MVPGRQRKSVAQLQRRIQLIEKVYLAFNQKKISIKELADMVNRSEKQVNEFIKDNNGIKTFFQLFDGIEPPDLKQSSEKEK